MSSKYTNWTNEAIAEEAAKYQYRSEFMQKSELAYAAARHRNILDVVCQHMEIKHENWSESLIHQEALKYNQRKEFQIKNPNAYAAAQRKNIVDKVCSHMDRGITGFNPDKPAILYYLSILGGTAYKIGISNRTVKERFKLTDLEKIKVIKIEYFENGMEAYLKEQAILTTFKDAKYKGDNLLESGNTELFNYDILGLDLL